MRTISVIFVRKIFVHALFHGPIVDCKRNNAGKKADEKIEIYSFFLVGYFFFPNELDEWSMVEIDG